MDHNKLWKILKEMSIPDHLPCLLRNLYTGQEATVRTGYGKTDWFQVRKGVHQGCILSPCLFNLYAEYIMRNPGLEEAQAGIKIAGRNNNLRNADDTTLMSESEKELKSLLIKVKEESEKVGLQLNIQKNKIMASGPITSWQIDGETVETMFPLLGLFWGAPKSLHMLIAAMKLRHLLLGRKVMTNQNSILKSRDITFPTMVRLVKAMVFPVVMYGCESWTVKGWDGWMASLTQWTWVWVNSGSWWWTGRPGVLQFMGLQRVGHNWATELNWTFNFPFSKILSCIEGDWKASCHW